MEQTEFIELCIHLFHSNGIPCTEERAKKLYELTARMLKINESMNLTAIKDEKGIILRHYVDSITVSRYIPDGSRVIDVGCGAGFPTLPLAIFRPDLKIVALDSTAKRINYVKETAEILGLNNVTAIAGRAEEYALLTDHRERYDVVTARAVAALPILCELCLPFARIGGQMIAMKSQRGEDELKAAARCIDICGGNDIKLVSCDLVCEDAEPEQRNLIFIQKSQKTPKNYPRHFSKISKKPL